MNSRKYTIFTQIFTLHCTEERTRKIVEVIAVSMNKAIQEIVLSLHESS